LRASGRKAKSIAIAVSNRLTPHFSAQLAYVAGKTLHQHDAKLCKMSTNAAASSREACRRSVTSQ
jgi:hypothetical protein